MAAVEERADRPWRSATRGEIGEYYQNEFPTTEHAFPNHISVDGPQEWAIAFQQRYPTRGSRKRKFIRRKTESLHGSDLFGSFSDVIEFIQSPAHNDPLLDTDSEQALAHAEVVQEENPNVETAKKPIPHAVYYGLQQCDGSWVLGLDVDAKDIAADEARQSVNAGENVTGTKGLLKAAGILKEEPEGYKYAFRHIDQALEWGFEIESQLQSTFNFTETMVVYSGQGCHIYGFDEDPYHRYDQTTREVLNTYLEETMDAPIDTQVTADRKRVLRLPYSLHADVCRIVTPIESPKFDYLAEATPEFLEQGGSHE
jgi:hypothetical protein